MITRLAAVAAVAMMGAAIVGSVSAQTKKPEKPAEAKSATHSITVKADAVYTGTVALAVNKGKVSGDMRLTAPTEITGKIAGTSKDGVLKLEFPYHMTENNCDGNVKMSITMPATPGPANGTMEASGCGDPSRTVTGTVELVPVDAKKK